MSDIRKAKTTYVGGTTVFGPETITIYLDIDGSVSFGPEVQNVHVRTEYERNKGPKTVSWVPINDKLANFEFWPTSTREYDQIFAVDTNYNQHSGGRISVTGILEVRQNYIGGSGGMSMFWKFVDPVCIEFRNLRVPDEKFGWLYAIDFLTREGRLDPKKRTALIVDSELGNLAAFNNRTQPVLPGAYLPKGITLVYGSSDTAQDQVLNKSIGVADSVASQCLKAICAGKVPPIRSEAKNDFFENMRVIRSLPS